MTQRRLTYARRGAAQALRLAWNVATRLALSLSLSLSLGLSLAACEAELQRGLSEPEANAIVVALDEHGIGATKSSEAGGGDAPTYSVTVSPDDVAEALAVLRSEGLPRARETGFEEMFGQGSLVPTTTEERARMTAALSGELARSIESIDGVLDARVHIALPPVTLVTLDAARPRARASVLVRHRGASAPYDPAAIQQLVAGAVEDMAIEDVAVVSVASTLTPSTSERTLAQVGPFTVARSSVVGLKAAFAALLVLNLLVVAALFWALARARRVRSEGDAPRT